MKPSKCLALMLFLVLSIEYISMRSTRALGLHSFARMCRVLVLMGFGNFVGLDDTLRCTSTTKTLE